MSNVDSQRSTGLYKVVGWVALVATGALFWLLTDAGSVELMSISVPVLLVAAVSYLLGVAAEWAFRKSRGAP